jgi:HAD superfamily hydrolase (TIGR01509 family)
MLGAVIFDFDGVIVEAEGLHLEAFNSVLDSYGVRISEKVYYDKYLPFDDIECIRQADTDFELGLDEEGISRLLREKMEVFARIVTKGNIFIDGAAEFIKMLGANGIRMAVCSGAALVDIELMLKDSGLRDYFETIVATDHIQNSKPAPDGYVLALERLNQGVSERISAEQCIVIEDSRWGLESARSAGMHGVGVTNTYPAEELADYAEKVVSQLTEITIEDLQSLCDG